MPVIQPTIVTKGAEGPEGYVSQLYEDNTVCKFPYDFTLISGTRSSAQGSGYYISVSRLNEKIRMVDGAVQDFGYMACYGTVNSSSTSTMYKVIATLPTSIVTRMSITSNLDQTATYKGTVMLLDERLGYGPSSATSTNGMSVAMATATLRYDGTQSAWIFEFDNAGESIVSPSASSNNGSAYNPGVRIIPVLMSKV